MEDSKNDVSKFDTFLSIVGFLCIVILVIGGFIAVWNVPWSTLVKVIITAGAILFMIALYRESKSRKKQLEEMERRAEERRKNRKPFQERVDQLVKDRKP